MAEYIEREAVVKYLRSRKGNFLDDMGKGWSNAMEIAASVCENANAADVVEVVRGEWRTVKLNGDKGTVLVECSECGCVFDLTLFACGLNYNFCPNCGADMREVDDAN